MRMERPKVSVVIPVYNVEQYLARCIESVRRQTLRDIEIILVDDGSPDSSPQMCDEYAVQDSRIKVIHKKNAGLGMACNTGIEIANGEYIAFCDSDDWVEPEMYAQLLEAAERDGAEVVYSGIRRVDSDGRVSPMHSYSEHMVIYARRAREEFGLDMIANEASVRLERSNPMSAKIVLYNLDMLRRHDIRFPSERVLISEDLIFNLDCILAAKRIATVPGVYYNYFVNEKSLSHSVRTDRFEKAKELREALLKRYEDIEGIGERSDRMFIGYAREAKRQIIALPISLTERLTLLKEICNDDIWREMKEDYPIRKMPIFNRLFLKCVLSKKVLFIYLILKYKT